MFDAVGTWWFWGLVLIAWIKTGKEKVQLGRGLSGDRVFRVFGSFWHSEKTIQSNKTQENSDFKRLIHAKDPGYE